MTPPANILRLPPVSLYVHFPWCVRKCPYCDFNSHAVGGGIPDSAYTSVLLDDLAADLPLLQGRTVHSVFFGGGTPSLFEPASVARVLEAVARTAGIETGAEITLEANPGTLEQGRFRAYRAAGVNRLSIGVQSFQDNLLHGLGRIHDGEEARAAIHAAREAGFSQVNLDLMHGLPGQDVHSALADLDMAVGLEPEHLSWYQLTIEPNTEFYRRPPNLPGEAVIGGIEESGIAMLDAAGYRRYEVSAYARPGCESRHNLNYWHFGDYLGIGAGAHGKITCADSGRVLRTRKTRKPADYLNAQFPPENLREAVDPGELPVEFLMNWFRTGEALDVDLFSARTGLQAGVLDQGIADARAAGLLEAASVRPTARGMRFLNDLLACF